MKNLGLFVILLCLFPACKNNDDMAGNKDNCRNSSLVTISDGESCDDSNFFLICEAVEVTDLIALEDEDFEWIPSFCNDIGSTINYRNEIDETFSITITDKDNFINKERVNVSCDKSIEHASYICQSNETAYIEFSTPIFDDHLTRVELTKLITEVKDGVLGNPKLRLNLEQPRANTNVYNFIFRIFVDDESENRSQEFHNEITINGMGFTEVYEVFIRESFWSEPNASIFVNKGNGILGFKSNNKYWLKDN